MVLESLFGLVHQDPINIKLLFIFERAIIWALECAGHHMKC